MAKFTLKTLTLAMALFVLAGCGKSKTSANGGPTFTDERDGKVYATTKIGKQVWMAENLNYAMDGSWCYDDNPANCEKYGRLYTWGAAMDVCPWGWHLPTSEEWDELENAVGKREKAGKELKSGKWNGTDALGFNALPAGNRYSGDGAFGNKGSFAGFWTATENYKGYAYRRYLRSEAARLYSSTDYKEFAFSVRCVKD